MAYPLLSIQMNAMLMPIARSESKTHFAILPGRSSLIRATFSSRSSSSKLNLETAKGIGAEMR